MFVASMLALAIAGAIAFHNYLSTENIATLLFVVITIRVIELVRIAMKPSDDGALAVATIGQTTFDGSMLPYRDPNAR